MSDIKPKLNDSIDFRLINQRTNQLNELYILGSGSDMGNNVDIEISARNDAGKAELYTNEEGNANRENFTVAIVFRSHVLDSSALDQIRLWGDQALKWQLQVIEENEEVVVYFLAREPIVKAPFSLWVQQIPVSHISATTSGIELRYRQKTDDQVYCCRQKALSVLNHSGIAKSPFRLLLDTPTVSTVHMTKNLTLRLLNGSGQTLDISRLRLQLVFDVFEDSLKSPQALMKKTDLKEAMIFELKSTVNFKPKDLKIGKSVLKGKVNDGSGATSYRSIVDFNPSGKGLKVDNEPAEIGEGQFLIIKFPDFQAYKQAGQSPVIVRFFNVEGFRDGELTCEVKRTAVDESSQGKIKLDNKAEFNAETVFNKKVEVKASFESSAVTLDKLVAKSNEVIEAPKMSMKELKSPLINDQYGRLLPPGTIVMWSGNTPPEGWVLCDGQSEVDGKRTPNLSGRFIVGLDKTKPDYDKVKKGKGKEFVKLSINQLPRHSHKLGDDHFFGYIHYGLGGDRKEISPFLDKTLDSEQWRHHKKRAPGYKRRNLNTQLTGGGSSFDNRPPYYVLAYIMKK